MSDNSRPASPVESDLFGRTPPEAPPRPLRGTDHHYVILVHGTFNRPEPGTPHWAVADPASPDSFATHLNECLAETAIGQVVNRAPDGPPRTFVWDAGNTDADRRTGGRRLREYLDSIVEHDPNARIHLVGHSHGGNVILCALEQYYASLQRRADHYSSLPWFVWRWGDATQGFLRRQPTDLADAADRLVRKIAHADETLSSILLGMVFRLLFESNPKSDRSEPEATHFRQYHCASPTTNRLGRVVFLGTPFYHKRWRARNPLEWLLDLVFNSAGLVLYWSVIGYLVALVLFTLPSLILAGHVPWNPWTWPLPAQVLFPLYVSLNTYRGFEGETRMDGNVYWNREEIERYALDEPIFLRSVNLRCDGRLSALTVTAPYLDEALLGLVSEPLLLGRLRRELRRFVAPEWLRGPAFQVASGVRFTRMNTLRHVLVFGGRQIKAILLAAGYFVTRIPWRWAYDWVLEPAFFKAVFGALSSTATGLPSSEYAGAIIEPSHRADIPELLNETILDVTEIFLSGPDSLRPAAPAAGCSQDEIYSFLKDDVVLRERLAADGQWQAVEQELQRLARFYQRHDLEAFSNELARRWLAVRVRAAAVLQGISLNHGRYYADGRVVKAVAEFIAQGSVSSLRSEPNSAKPQRRPRQDRPALNLQRFAAQPTSLDDVVVSLPPDQAGPAADLGLGALLRSLEWHGDVAVSRKFVSCRLFREFAEAATTSDFFFYPEHWRGPSGHACDGTEPVGGVRAGDAWHFCNWLGRLFGGHLKFRLPTPTEARRVRVSSRDRVCWCESKDKRKTLVGWPSYGVRCRQSRRAIRGAAVPFPADGFGGLPLRGVTVLNPNWPPVHPVVVALVSRGVFNRTAPDDAFHLPPGLGALGTLVEDLRHGRSRLLAGRRYADGLLGSYLRGLAADPFPECAQVYQKIREEWHSGADVLRTIEELQAKREALLAHTARLLEDLIRAAAAPSDAEAFAWLQVAGTRTLEYCWHAREWYRYVDHQVQGPVPYHWNRLVDRLTGRHGKQQYNEESLWQLYWWLRFAIARGEGVLPPLEGIRIGYEGKREDLEQVLKNGF